jgi:hypothetical protein
MSCRYSLPILVALISSLAKPCCAATSEQPRQEIQEYLIVGTVVWANAATASMAIRGTSLIGRLRVEVKSYHVKEPGTLANLHPGDRITAVFSAKDGMLHSLRRMVRQSSW